MPQPRTTLSLPTSIYEQINEAVARGFFNTRADFLKSAIRNELERELRIQQLKKEEARQ